MMMQAGRRHSFTLVELMVSIAIFVVILLMMLQFLTGTQKIWQGASGRGDVYIESKAAMDLMVDLLREPMYVDYVLEKDDGSTQVYQSIFRIERRSDFDRIYFVSRSPIELVDRGNDLDCYSVALKVEPLSEKDIAGETVTRNALCLWTHGSACPVFEKAYTEYDATSAAAMEGSDSGKDNRTVIIPRQITGLEFIPGYRNASGVIEWDAASPNDKPLTGGDYYFDELPDVLMIKMRMLDANSFATYEQISDNEAKRKFRQQHELNFTRIITYDGRGYAAK